MFCIVRKNELIRSPLGGCQAKFQEKAMLEFDFERYVRVFQVTGI